MVWYSFHKFLSADPSSQSFGSAVCVGRLVLAHGLKGHDGAEKFGSFDASGSQAAHLNDWELAGSNHSVNA